MEAAFAEFDVNGDRMISKAEFVKILTREGVGQAGHLFEEEEAEQLFDEFDADVKITGLDPATSAPICRALRMHATAVFRSHYSL